MQTILLVDDFPDLLIEGLPDIFSDSVDNLDDILKRRGINLCYCDAVNDTDYASRGESVIYWLSKKLDSIVADGKADSLIGVVMDLQIHVRTLGIFSSQLNRVATNNGADTGYQLARYIFANDRNLSPYQNMFSDVPILYHSLSKYEPHANSFTSWMGDSYRPYEMGRMQKYTHLAKHEPDKTIQAVLDWSKNLI